MYVGGDIGTETTVGNIGISRGAMTLVLKSL